MAVGLVLLGSSLASAPPPVPTIGAPGGADSPREVAVILRDYAFNPDPLHLVPGETIRFTILNGGLIDHEFVLGDAAVQAAWARANAEAVPPAPFASSPPASVPIGTGGLRVLVSSGQSAVADYVVPQLPDLQLACHLPGHLDEGMRARVELRVANMSATPTR